MAKREKKRLTAMAIERQKTPGTYADGDGLQLIVTDVGTKRWVLLLQVDGHRRKLGLGLYPGVSLDRARRLAADHRHAAAAGTPLPTKREVIRTKRAEKLAAAAPGPMTLRQAFEVMWPIKRAQLANPKHAAQWETTLATYAWPALSDRPVAEIQGDEIIRVLQLIWSEKPETASRVLQRLSAIFQFAIVRGDRERANPCIGIADVLGTSRTATRQNMLSLPWQEVPEFLKALRLRGGLLSSRLCFELLILTATRSGEARGARWDEIDLRALTWTIPAERMKMKRPHVVPLSTGALAVLKQARAAHPDSALVFPGAIGQVLSDMTLTKRLRDMGLSDRATAHGFRSSFKTWATEQRIDDFVTEIALAHVDKNRVRAAYQRSDLLDERRIVMQRWADHCG